MIVDDKLPLTSLQSVILTTGPLVFLWTYLRAYVEKHGAFRWAVTFLDIHNFIIAALSLLLASYVLDIGHNVLAVRKGYAVEPYLLGYIFHLLKVYEYLDIILGILAGNTAFTKYVAFSHISMPYWSYFRIIARTRDSVDWRLQVIADCSARCLNRAIPWLINDVRTKNTLLGMVEDFRWYADLIICGMWAFFTFQGQRQNAQAIKIFGQPYKDEGTSRMIGAIIILYAGHVRRQEVVKSHQEKTQNKASDKGSTSIQSSTSATTTNPSPRVSQR